MLACSTLDDGWVVAAPAEVGFDAESLSGLDAFLKQWPKCKVHAVVIVRRGKLVFERYFAGRERRWMEWSAPVQFSAETKHDIRSISKSVTSLLIGLAISEGQFPPLDSRVIDYFPEYADLRTTRNARITFRHLLTMSHGLRWDEARGWNSQANNERHLLEAKDPYRYVLQQRMALPPGVSFNYSGGATSLLAAALAKSVGQRIDAFARDKLFEPLGITDVEWSALPAVPNSRPLPDCGYGRATSPSLANSSRMMDAGTADRSCPPRGSPSRPSRGLTPEGTWPSTMVITGGLAVPC
ncbi:CubicO group peptidase (beta-lactamase class C family) [Bradyrhizobium sp. USDA 4501]